MSRRWLLSIALLGLVCAWAAPTDVTESVGDGTAMVNWTQGWLTATGTGPLPRGATSRSIAIQRRVAITDAYRQLGEALSGVKVSSETTIEMYELTNDSVKTKMAGLVKGAQVAQQGWDTDGKTYLVTLRAPLYGQAAGETVADVILPAAEATPPERLREVKAQLDEPLPSRSVDIPEDQPEAPTPLPERKPGPYTGLVVDTRGFAIERAMAPKILDPDEEPVWGHKPVDRELVKKVGIVGYLPSLEAALDAEHSRAGKNPLVVRAIGREGSFKANAVVSAEDAALITAENQKLKPKDRFLENLRVVFVVDAE
ncbi:MAG: LPP20 family lipoprotein [Fimbriimonadaceae bacterium]|nr:LPP20 family lipoprotein [Fimbriimonadaceae bacterium]